MSTSNKYILLIALYFSQGLPFGFFAEAIEPLAAQRGWSDEAIGLLALLALPWTLKFLWAPFVDRYYHPRIGQRRSWILPLQLCTIIAILIVSQIDSVAHFTWVLVIYFLINLFASTQDVATDGFACSMLTPAQRGIGNGIQVAAYRFGMIIGGGVLLIMIDELTWQGAFFIVAALLMAATLIVLFTREPAPVINATPKKRFQLIRYVVYPGVFAWLLFIFFYKFGDSVASGMVKTMLIKQGYTLTDIGSASGLVGSITGLAGALFGGWLCSKIKPIRLLPLFIILQALTSLGYAAIYHGLGGAGALQFVGDVENFMPKMNVMPIVYHPGGYELLYGVMGLESFVSGMHTAGIFTLMMFAVRPLHEGNDYTIQASIIVLGTGMGKALAGLVSGGLGYLAPILLGTILIFVVLIPLHWMQRRGGFRALSINAG